MVSHSPSSYDVKSKQKQHRINRRLSRIFQMCSNLSGQQNWLSHGHPKTLGQMNRGILVSCGNQYCIGNSSAQVLHFNGDEEGILLDHTNDTIQRYRIAKNQGTCKFKECPFERRFHSIFYVGINMFYVGINFLSQICYALSQQRYGAPWFYQGFENQLIKNSYSI